MDFAGPRSHEMEVIAPDPQALYDLAQTVVDPSTQRLRLLPAAVWQGFSPSTLRFFCCRTALYGIPTVELVEWLRERCAGKTCVEIGSGNNDLCYHLGIRGTDSYMQTSPMIAAYVALLGQSPTTPRENVERGDAEDVVRKMKPEVVIGSWVTDRFNPARPAAGGNAYGPRDEYIIERTGCYIHIGNENVHGNKVALRLPHETFKFPWLVSRAKEPAKNIIYVWKK